MKNTIREWKPDQLREALSALPQGRRRWFATYAASRLNNRLADTDGSPKEQLRVALAVLSDHTTGPAVLRPLLDRCDGLVQDEDADGYDSDPVADNAVVATCYALEAALGDEEAALWAATQAHETVDYMAHTELDADFNDVEQMALVASHSVVQEELAAQEADLKLLMTAEVGHEQLAERARSYLG